MPKDYPRSRRIGVEIQRELADLIRFELKDPRVGQMVTLTGVEVSADQSHAKVFFTILGDEAAKDSTAAGLKRAAGFLRTQLSQRLQLRTVPQLDFKYDASVERGAHLSRLIDEAVGSSRKNPPGDT